MVDLKRGSVFGCLDNLSGNLIQGREKSVCQSMVLKLIGQFSGEAGILVLSLTTVIG